MIVIERFLSCDRCNKNYGVDNRNRTARQHRYYARREGWDQYKSFDYCPECISTELLIDRLNPTPEQDK